MTVCCLFKRDAYGPDELIGIYEDKAEAEEQAVGLNKGWDAWVVYYGESRYQVESRDVKPKKADQP
jgi:hypothetical protein